MMTKTEYFVLLNMIDGVGPVKAKALLEYFGDAESIFKANRAALLKIENINANDADAIVNAEKTVDLDDELKLIERHDVRIVTLQDEDYPALLKEIYAPPVVLYVKGALAKDDNFAVAIVGARRCTHYGMKVAGELASQLSRYGATVVSGLARGIDSAAHRGALEAKGRTVGILGNGLASIYPPENKRLAQMIEENGAVVSEFSMQTKPYKDNFPRRNRIISGLSQGVVVVEASRTSGALITAAYALEQNREVFAVPGNTTSATSYGTNKLIKDGAKLVESAEDIMEELKPRFERRPDDKMADKFSGDEKRLYQVLSYEPQDVEELTEKLSLPVQNVNNILLKLELSGVAKQLPGKRFILR